MNQHIVFSIGFLAQLLFSARQLSQWIVSEKAGRILSPALLAAEYPRILPADDLWHPAQRPGHYPRPAYHLWRVHSQSALSWLLGQNPCPGAPYGRSFPGLAIFWLLSGETYNIHTIFSNKAISSSLMTWGLIGQTIFTFRFIYQWLYSEKRHQSLLPLGFWIISITGSMMVLSYAVFRKDPVLFIGQLFGVVIKQKYSARPQTPAIPLESLRSCLELFDKTGFLS